MYLAALKLQDSLPLGLASCSFEKPAFLRPSWHLEDWRKQIAFCVRGCTYMCITCLPARAKRQHIMSMDLVRSIEIISLQLKDVYIVYMKWNSMHNDITIFIAVSSCLLLPIDPATTLHYRLNATIRGSIHLLVAVSPTIAANHPDEWFLLVYYQLAWIHLMCCFST